MILRDRMIQSIRIIILGIYSVICLAPFYVAMVYAFKSKTDFAKTKLSFPTQFYLGNFREAIEVSNFINSIKNSIVVSIATVTIIIFICSAGAYIIARKSSYRFYNTIFYVFHLIILLPIQTTMFPLYKTLSNIGALNTLWGLTLAESGVTVGYYVFLYTGFIKTVPISLEESSIIDGCNRYQTFFKIVFPLLKPITMTVIVLAFLGSWNNLMLAMIICQKQIKRTLPLMQFYFFGEYSANVSVAFASGIMSMIPAVLIYFLAQKYIVAGMTAGAVKN